MGLLVEMGWGGLVQLPDTITWTDISQYADVSSNGGVSITRGASDELSDAQPGTATLRLDNLDGRFTPGNASSPYSPYVRRNAPIRIAVTDIPETSGSAPYPLAQLGDDFDDNSVNTTLWPGNYGGASEVGGRARIPLTPGTPAGYKSARDWDLSDSQFVIKVASLPVAGGSTSASVTIVANSTTAGTRVGFYYSPVDGFLRCLSDVAFFDAGATVLTYQPIAHMWLRIRETGGTLYWETAPDGYNWTVRRSLATPAWIASQSVIIEMIGARTGGAADYVEVDLAGATVYPRFYGTVNEFPIDWEGLASTVSISATDLFKRLGRDEVLRSCLAEEIVLDRPHVYFPLTEPSGSVTGGDLAGTTAGVGSLSISQAGSGGTLTFGEGTGPAATGDAVPQFAPVGTSNGKYLTADLGPDYETATLTRWNHVEFWFSTTLAANRIMVALRSADDEYQLAFALSATGTLQLEYVIDGPGALTAVAVTSGVLSDGLLHHVVYDENAQEVWVDGVNKTFASVPFVFRLRHLSVGGFKNTKIFEGTVSHVAVYTTASGGLAPVLGEHYTAGTTAFSGESADDRIQRLVSYTGLDSAVIYGSTHDPVASQGEGGQTALTRMREIEQTESAKLFAARDWFLLDYLSRDLRYNPDPSGEAFTIEYADLETGEVQLKDDDQKLINSVVASRPGGATQRVTAPQSILAFGKYAPPGGDLAILKTSDNSVLDAAYWLVTRYANPQPELREVPIEAYSHPEYTSILSADIGSYFSVTDLPSQAPSSEMRVTVEGYAETIRNGSHRITFHTSQTIADSVWVLDDSTYSILDSTTRLAY